MLRRRTRRSGWSLAALACLLTLGGCVGGEVSTPLGTGPSAVVKEGDGPGAAEAGPELPVLVEMKSEAGETFTRVLLQFEPGNVEPNVDNIEQYDDSTIPMPGQGNAVDFLGDQALKVTISPAQFDEVNVAPVQREDPAVTEVRVLGTSANKLVVGIGVKGERDLRPKVLKSEHDTDPHTHLKYDTIVISLRNPPPGK